MFKPVRKFKCPDVVCLDASDTLVDIAIDNYADIVKKRQVLKDPYFPNLKVEIAGAYSQYLGIDNAKVLRNATAAVHLLQSQSLKLLGDFKSEIEFSYSEDKAKRDDIFNTLGIKSLYRSAAKGDQEDLVELLNKFSTNMTVELEAEITSKGMDPSIITSIKNNAVPFQLANTAQEKAKGTRQVNTAEGINALNAIYTKVTGFCKLVRKDLQGDPVKQKLFSFSAVVKAIMGNKGNDNPPDNPTPPAQ